MFNPSLNPCDRCGGTGFSGHGTGYDDVCDFCTGGYVMQRFHDLKCWSVHYQDVIAGIKKAELRLNDRDFNTGDILVLWETVGENDDRLTGCASQYRVTHIVREFEALKPGYVMMSIEPYNEYEVKNYVTPASMTKTVGSDINYYAALQK